MKSLVAFTKKEWMETVRSGKLLLLGILFVLFGIMNPAIAKLTPWMLEVMAASLSETGLMVTQAKVDALTSWTQFFKNIPIGLIAFLLVYSSTFTKEYQSGTLVLILTKGLPRFKAVLAKSIVMLFMWTLCYWGCFAITFGYNFYFWESQSAEALFPAAACCWLFGIWTICLLILCSSIFRNNTGVLLGAAGTVLAAYVAGLFPDLRTYMPTALLGVSPALEAAAAWDMCRDAIAVAAVLSVVCVGISIPIINRKQI